MTNINATETIKPYRCVSNLCTDSSGAILASGSLIGGVYEIIELIGKGGMGEVYLCRHKTLGKKCALKVMPPELVTDLGWLRFQQEARSIGRMEHTNLVQVTDLGIHNGNTPFFAMEYVPGENLADILARSGPLPVAKVVDIFMQVCDAVEYAHRRGVLHRDLKPANIMVQCGPAQKRLAKVLDFGLAKLSGQDRLKQSLTVEGDVFGSPSYMSPEQCTGGLVDERSDIYSFGCTMFECLTGRPPFVGNIGATIIFSHLEATPPSLLEAAGSGAFPPALEMIMAKMLQKKPAARYQSFEQLKRDLSFLADPSIVQQTYSNLREISAPTSISSTATTTSSSATSSATSISAETSDERTVSRRPSVLSLLQGHIDKVMLCASLLLSTFIVLAGWFFLHNVDVQRQTKVNSQISIAGKPTISSANLDNSVLDMDESLDGDSTVFYLNLAESAFVAGAQAVERKDFAGAVPYFSKALLLVPVEENKFRTWRAGGCIFNKPHFQAYVYQYRAYCYLNLARYSLAIEDLNQAIKLDPDSAANYENRAKAYLLTGKKALAAADMKMARQAIIKSDN